MLLKRCYNVPYLNLKVKNILPVQFRYAMKPLYYLICLLNIDLLFVLFFLAHVHSYCSNAQNVKIVLTQF